MKYTLVLGIAYKKYKNPGDIAVYVGGRLIDAFQIDQDVTFVCEDAVTSLLDETWYRRLDLFRWLARLGTDNYTETTFADATSTTTDYDHTVNHATHELVPKLFKIYEIEEQDLNGLVEIKVDNSYNDYNNGFMKNNSMIRFPCIGLFPSHFVENRGEQLMRIAKKIGGGSDKYEKRTGRNRYDDYKHLLHTWPRVGSFYTKRQNNMHEKDRVLTGRCWIGGDFTAEIPIKTKHRIKYLSSMAYNETGFFWWDHWTSILATCKPLLNIYNEDQRSNRTKD